MPCLRSPALYAFAWAALLGAGARPAAATNYRWIGLSSTWGNGNNWTTGTAPASDLTNTDLFFGTSGSTASSLDKAYGVHSLTFDSGPLAYVFSGGTLTLGTGGFIQNAANAQTFNNAVVLGADQTWTLASGAGALNFVGSGVSTTNGNTAYALTINAASTTGSGNTVGGAITGGGSLTKTGAGTLTLTGASTYTGVTNVNAGTLAFEGGGGTSGAGAVTVNAGTTLSLNTTGTVGLGSGAVLTVDGSTTTSANLSVVAGTLTAQSDVVIGKVGLAAAAQNGGTVNVGGQLFLGTPYGNSANPTTAAGTYTLNGGTLNAAYVQLGNFGTGTFVQNGGTQNIGNSLLMGVNSGVGSYTLTAGTLGAINEYVGYSASGSTGSQTVAAGRATFTQSGGTNNLSGQLVISRAANTVGTYTLSGNAANGLSTASTNVGAAGTGTFIQSGGTHTVGNGGQLFIAANPGSTGTYNLSGGTVLAPSFDVADRGTAVFNQTGGTAVVAGTLDIAYYAEGVGTYTLGGNGVVQVGSGVLGGSGQSTFHFNGGTLQATAASTTLMQGLTLADVQANAARIDTNGFNVTVAQPILHSADLGATLDGGLTKTGTGTLTLAGANTFTGVTSGTGGTVNLANAGALQNSTVLLTSSFGLTFDGGVTGNAFTVGGLAGNAGLVLANNASTPAAITLNVGGGNASSTYFGGLSGAGSLVKVGTGTFALGGASTFTGGAAVNAGTLTIANPNALQNSTLTVNSGGSVAFANTNGSFNLGGLAGSGSFALTDTAAGAAGVAVGGNNASTTYSGSLGGPGGLTKTGTGTLTLTGANTFTGGTTISAGTLTLGNANALAGSTLTLSSTGGAVSFAGGINNFNVGALSGNANLALSDASGARVSILAGNNGANTTYSGVLSGVGGLTKTGAGTLTLTGASSYQNTTRVNGGTLVLAVGASLASGTAYVGDGASGALVQNGTSFSTGTGFLYLGNSAVATGTYTLNAGSLNVGTGYLGYSGTGSFIQNGGSVTSSGNLYLGYNAAASGTYALNAGNLNVGNVYVGLSGTGSFIQNGGSVTGDTGRILTVGYGAGSSGTYTLNAGSLSMSSGYVGRDGAGNLTQNGGNAAFSTTLYIGYDANSGTYTLGGGTLATANTQVSDGATGTFTQTGGTHTAGTLRLTGFSIGSVGTYNLLGGVLSTGQILNHDAFDNVTGTSTFLFGGGTLRASASNAAFMQGFTATNVGAGGARIDTQGYSDTIAQNLSHDPAVGVPAIDGGLLKLGTGTLTLSGTNTFTGPVTINAGTLAVASEANLGSGQTVTVNGSGRLAIAGSATLSREYDLGTSTLTATGGSTLTFGGGALVNGGYLAGPGADALGGGSTVNATVAQVGSTLNQSDGGTATLNNVTVRGALNQTSGTLAFNNSTGTTSSVVTVGGTMNASGSELDGVTTVNGGGVLNTAGTSLFFGGGARATVNAGGTLAAAVGTGIELNGALLVNNGTQSGTLNVNYGGQARGSGYFGDVTVNPGGQFGNNAVGGTSTTMAAFNVGGPLFTAAPSTSTTTTNLAAAIFVGPQPSTTPQVVNVASLDLKAGSTLNFNLQNTQLPAGTGYDLTRVGNGLTLEGSNAPGQQIVLRLIGLDGNGNQGAVSSFDAGQSYQFAFVQTGGGITGYVPGGFVVNTAGFGNDLQGGRFNVVQQGNNLVLVFTTAVPEPATWALLVVGAVGLWMMRRRRLHGDSM